MSTSEVMTILILFHLVQSKNLYSGTSLTEINSSTRISCAFFQSSADKNDKKLLTSLNIKLPSTIPYKEVKIDTRKKVKK